MFTRKRGLVSVLIALLFLGSVMNYAVPAYAEESEDTQKEEQENDDSEAKDSSDDSSSKQPEKKDTSELEASIAAKRKQITDAQNEKKKIQGNLSDVKKMVQSLEAEKANLEAYVTQLDGDLAEIQSKIEELKGLIADKENEIEKTIEELDEAKEIQATQYANMKKRIKFMYERGETFYLDLLFSSHSFADMINKADYAEQLSAYDSRKLAEYKQTCEYVAACKEQLDSEKELLDAAKQQVEEEEKNVETLIAAKEDEINATTIDINNKEAAIKEYEEYLAMQNATIQALEAAVAEEVRRLEEESGSRRSYDGGMFKWPCPSYKRISDDYGNRIHPTLGIEKFHNGIDLAASAGAPILAAYDGDVVAADYNASMGNYIMINHGDGLYTIYMHASSLYVSKGQTVSKGQKIAGVGTTGRSTGNHLHFSVRKNGSYVSPWNYLGR